MSPCAAICKGMTAEFPGLARWIARQARVSAANLERAISATHLCRRREGFGQIVVPAPGSVLASPEMADWDPEPDYFFHWLRNSAIVMYAVAGLMGDAEGEADRARWRLHFGDFVSFSPALSRLDGPAFLARSRHRSATWADHQQFLRPDAEISALAGDAVLAEARFNPDGTIDITRWSRPQYDGPALRALACLRYLAAGGAETDELRSLLRLDLAFTARHADHSCIGPWEEEEAQAHHYFTALVQLGALAHGRRWAEADAAVWQAAEDRLRAGLARRWSNRHGVYAAARDDPAGSPGDLVDAAELVAVVSAALPSGAHSADDPRVHATQAAIEDMFARTLPINRALPAGSAPALGRWRGDRYFGGGAWYPTTLAAAALCYMRACDPNQDGPALARRGDAYMATVQALTPADGSLSEQVDRSTGRPSSARHLSWSYAAFLEAARLRARALAHLALD